MSRSPRFLSGFLFCSAVLLTVAPLHAQNNGTVRGRVIHATAERPVRGAQVFIPGTGRGGLTNAEGVFILTNVPVGAQRVRVENIGFAPQEKQVTVTAGQVVTVDFAVSESAIGLDELVVTGTVGGTQRRALGNVVSTVRAEETVDKTLVPNVQGLINGRASNVVIMPGTGMVGTGSKIRIRGASSLSLSNEPLIYVDGIRVDNAQATGPVIQGFGSSVISRLNDFNPDDIESIEIIKGPAAATLYGTEAANGVIQIITKRGNIGRPSFRFITRQGASWFNDYENRIWTNYWRNPKTGEVQSLNLAKAEAEAGNPLFETGRLQNYTLSVNGGSEAARYYVAVDYDDEGGAEPTNRLDRLSGRMNMSLFPHSRVDVTGSVGYVRGRTYLSCEAGCGGVTWGSYFSTPAHLNENLPAGAPPRRGYRSFTKEAYYLSENFQDLTRFTGSIQAEYRTTSWLTQRFNVGTDEVREDNQGITERSQLLTVFCSTCRGGKSVSRRDVSVNTLDYSANVRTRLRSDISSNTSLGAQFFRRFSRFVSASGSEFVLPGLRAVNAANIRTGGETFFENTTVGVFGQQQFGWKDRLFVTAGIRADDNSAFGEDFDLVYYPKAQAAWVVTEEPFWQFNFVNTLRLRAAYGQSGTQPAAFAALRTFGATTGPNDVATVTPSEAGNPALGPERSSEIEAGFDAGFFNDRVTVEATLYNKRTFDAILIREAPPSQGFPGSQFVNLGELKNSGFELLLRGNAFARRNAALDLTFTWATNDSEVIDLGDNETLVESSTFGVEHRVGYPAGSWFHVNILSAQLDQAGKVIRSSMTCEGENGSPVPCYTGSSITAPRVFLGRTLPKHEAAFSGTLTLFERLRIYGMVDMKLGHSKWDHNLRVRCSLFNICRENMYPLEYDPVTIAAYQNSDRFGAAYINEADFAKLREVSLSYTLPSAWAMRFGAQGTTISLAARNLATWTKWEGMEPEAMYLGGARGGFTQLEQNNVPQLTQFVTTVNVNF